MVDKRNASLIRPVEITKIVVTFILFSIFAFGNIGAGSVPAKKSQSVQYVYVSASSAAKCYHVDRNCRSLKRSKKVNKMTLSDAKKSKRACKNCSLPKQNSRNYLDEPVSSALPK